MARLTNAIYLVFQGDFDLGIFDFEIEIILKIEIVKMY